MNDVLYTINNLYPAKTCIEMFASQYWDKARKVLYTNEVKDGIEFELEDGNHTYICGKRKGFDLQWCIWRKPYLTYPDTLLRDKNFIKLAKWIRRKGMEPDWEMSPSEAKEFKEWFAKREKANKARRDKDQVYRDCGLTRCVVNGKVFWE